MGHQHHWQSEPPQGRLSWKKSWDEQYGDEEDMASNAMYNSPEEIKQLRLMLKKDPSFEECSDWPHLVEWCSSCTSTRMVRLVLPGEGSKVVQVQEEQEARAEAKVSEEGESCEATAKDASTQTPGKKPRRRGGQGSRRRRMLAFQQMLTVKRGLPLSRLLLEESNSKSKAKFLKLQEESASPRLKAGQVKVKMEKKEEGNETHTVKEEKEEESHSGKEASTSGSKFSTLRSFPTGEIPPSSQPLPHRPCFPPPPVVQPPLFTLPWVHQQFGQMPAPNWVICGGCQMLGTLVPFWAAQ